MNANNNTRNTRNNNSRRVKRAYIGSRPTPRPSMGQTLGSAFEASNHRLFAAPTSDGFTEVVGRKAASKAKVAMYKPQDMVTTPNRFAKPTEKVVEEVIPAAKAAPFVVLGLLVVPRKSSLIKSCVPSCLKESASDRMLSARLVKRR